MNPNKKNPRDANDEVEELLRAAQDAALLKININSHTVHASPSDLDPDLEQRFRNLKSGSKSKAKKESVIRRKSTPKSEKVNEEVEEDDLLARFASLKASLPKPTPSISSSFVGIGTSDTSFGDDRGDGSLGGKVNIDDEDEDEDEVEKVIRWAVDAARLDPSPSSDDEGIDSNDDLDDYETSDDTSEDSKKKPKGKQK